MPNLVAQVKRALGNSDAVLVSDLYDAKFCTPAETVSLLHFDDPDNPYKDECGNTWSFSNVANSDSVNARFGSYCLYLSNSNRFFRTSNSFYLGGQDFTFDFWGKGCIYAGVDNRLNDNTNSSTDVILQVRSGVGGVHYNYPGISQQNLSDFFNAKPTKMTHYAVVYAHSAQRVTIYENGVNKKILTFSLSRQRMQAQIGLVPNNGGYIDEFRIVDGQALWTSNFTPPTEPYKLVDGHIPVKIKGSTQKLWMPFNFIKTDLTPEEDTDTTVADSDTT